MPHTQQQYVALVCRLSPRPDGSYEGVDAQERWGRAYAAEHWPGMPIEVFADRGISAANDDIRPEYERFRQWVRDGRIKHVWVVETARLERHKVVEWFKLADELYDAGITEIHTSPDREGIVRVNDVVGEIRAVLNHDEVRRLKRRLNDTLAEKAARGVPPGSRPFGYRHATTEDGTKTYEIVPKQAEAIRGAAEKVLAGWSLAHIVVWWRDELGTTHGTNRRKVRNEEGMVLLDDGRWVEPKHPHVKKRAVTRPSVIKAHTVRSILLAPSIAGYRVHQGRVVGKGNWEPILDDATWQRVRLTLTAPRVVHRVDGGTYPVSDSRTREAAARKYLLTGGLAECGVCGKPMIGANKWRGKNQRGAQRKKPYLLCHPVKGGKACTAIVLKATEAHVLDYLFDLLDSPRYRKAIAAENQQADRDRISGELRGLEEQRNELAQMWSRRDLWASEWQAARQGIAQREQELRDEYAALPPPVVDVDYTQLRDAWPEMPLDEQRRILRAHIARVVVSPATPGLTRFDPTRLHIEMRRR